MTLGILWINLGSCGNFRLIAALQPCRKRGILGSGIFLAGDHSLRRHSPAPIVEDAQTAENHRRCKEFLKLSPRNVRNNHHISKPLRIQLGEVYSRFELAITHKNCGFWYSGMVPNLEHEGIVVNSTRINGTTTHIKGMLKAYYNQHMSLGYTLHVSLKGCRELPDFNVILVLYGNKVVRMMSHSIARGEEKLAKAMLPLLEDIDYFYEISSCTSSNLAWEPRRKVTLAIKSFG
ncbi:hypothetical protein VNO77_04435 [Canavalia gladiata]|uniref:Uncharacterized protein n=1 Tax=Canavalia gladiata TaxID=3824 RepID=A0AAN9MWI3_CANGL